MNIDWEMMMFVAIWLGIFAGLPICVYFVLRFFFSGKVRKVIINVSACGGLAIALLMVAHPFMNPLTQPGSMGIINLIPLGVLLAPVCGDLMWFNIRARWLGKWRAPQRP